MLHIDKPVEIRIEGKGTVKNIYDADGAKLKREFLNSVTNANKVTWYLGEYQYEEVVGGPSPKALAVSFISFGEGRIRPITPRNESNTYDALQLDGNLTLPNGKKGSIDYFISDHRTDVQMVLTEEKQWSYTTASMETASSRNTVEEGLFSTQVNLSRAPKTEVPGWTANTSQYVSKLNNTRMVGPNQMLKVMAGDLLHANVQYYYQQVATNSSGSTVFGSVLSMLGSSITGSAVTSAATKAASTSIIANLNTGLPFSQVISPDITSSTGNLPKAYLNVVFFDERFNFVSESSTSVRVGAANVAANLALTQIKAPENGYCYVYISNESTVSVYFDNLQVRHDRGRIVEENHYYAYGLRINAISSKAYGGPANNYLYQGDFAELDEDLGWTDFMLRSYDAEIGRFLQNDPYDQFTSGYVGMGGDPVNLVDPTGGFSGGIGCPSVAGMVGYVSNMSHSLNAISNISSIISSVTTAYNVFSGTKSMIADKSIGKNYKQTGSKIIAISERVPYKNADNSFAEDMKYCTYELPAGVSFSGYNKLSNNQLFEYVESLFSWLTTGDLKIVAKEMITKFKNNSGGEYTSSILNSAVEKDNDFNQFALQVGSQIKYALSQVNGDFSKLQTFNIKMPHFSDLRNKATGLGILIHDVWAGNVEMSDYEYNSKTGRFSAILKFTLFDHFGLDKLDVIKNHDIWLKPPGGGAGFKAWYYLQHIRCLKPFLTKVVITKRIYGRIK